ncbi:nucleolar protein 14 [Dichotomocladium elegans]|nr:nucleolar protein 14 [Dichotomocladium elegans]
MAPAKQGQPKGSGGSALKRLKTSLRSAGVVGPQSKASRSKKARKRGIPTEVGKNSTADKLQLIRDEFNPFEIKTQNTKFNVIGRKTKGVTGKPALSKQIGEENRKKTLLTEMKSKGHVGGIIDKRFGENNPHLTPEEKMLERFTREKQKSAKATTSLFNLDDDDGEMGLTHYGQSLADMDDFDDTGLRLSDDEDGGKGQLSKEMVSQLHFGGFDDDNELNEDGKKKTRNEIMKEIISKSKFHKYERQLAKQADESLREDLDEELKEIRGMLETAEKPKRKPLVSQTALFSKAEHELQKNAKPEENENDYLDYDRLVQEMANDRRAMATDRTKTEEEIALEEKEKLEKAERARKRRMEGLESESEDESTSKHGRKRRKASVPQGDDLEDDYLDDLADEVNMLGKGLTLEDIQNAAGPGEDEESEEGGSDEDEDEDEDDEDEDDEDDYEESDNEDLEGDEVPDFGDDDDDMNEINTNGVVKKTLPKPKDTKAGTVGAAKKDIPYTFECPSTHDEFLDIMKELDVEDTPTVVKRIRVLYHIKLHADNKEKMSTFLGVLVDHLGYLASTVSPFPAKVLDSLIAHAFEISQKVPVAAADVFTQKLKVMHATMGRKMNSTGSAFPDVEDITLLRTLGKIFPTSDLAHPVVTPAMLYIGQALALCKVRSEVDIGRGIFLALLLHEYQAVSKRFVPEAMNFLQRALVLLLPDNTFDNIIPGDFPMPDEEIHLHIADTAGKNDDQLPALSLERLAIETVDEDEQNQFRLSLLQAILRLLTRYLQLYASTPALVEVFDPLKSIISRAKSSTWHDGINALLDTIEDRLTRQIKFCKDKRIKAPLRMQHHRPIPIAQHLPKFEERYSLDKHYDPDRERAEHNKLKAQLKKERKGAIRELRKDNMFLAREKAKQRKEKDEEYNKMIKGVMTLLETDQAEKNRLEREKKK